MVFDDRAFVTVDVAGTRIVFPTIFIAIPFLHLILDALIINIVLMVIFRVVDGRNTFRFGGHFQGGCSVCFFYVMGRIIAQVSYGGYGIDGGWGYCGRRSFRGVSLLRSVSVLSYCFRVIFGDNTGMQGGVRSPGVSAEG